MRVPKKPNSRRALPFYWYRRFKTHKCLPYKYPLIDKIKNGDFEYSPFFEQAKWELHWMKEEQEEFINNYQGSDPTMDMLYTDIEVKARKRYNKLYEDAMKDEHNRMDMLTNNLSKYYKLNKQKVKDFINEFEGTTIELFESLKYE
tara:strand:+ start:105 stop:542 length:438 start_codon:yes stop_codon:yes gene_type:complete